MVLVAVQLSVLGLYLPPVFKKPPVDPAPDNHFAAGPSCRVEASAVGRADNARCSPRIIGARINRWESVGSFVKIRGQRCGVLVGRDRRARRICTLKITDGAALRPYHSEGHELSVRLTLTWPGTQQ